MLYVRGIVGFPFHVVQDERIQTIVFVHACVQCCCFMHMLCCKRFHLGTKGNERAHKGTKGNETLFSVGVWWGLGGSVVGGSWEGLGREER